MIEKTTISGVVYNVERRKDEICLRRYNDECDMWVNLHFPIGNVSDDAKIIDALSNIYMERMAGNEQ